MSNVLERRHCPRVPVRKHHGLPTSVRDVSLGGLSIELAEELPVGSVNDFALPRADGTEVVVRARVVHARRTARPLGSVFIVGLQFVADVSDQASLRPLRLAS